MGNRHYDPQTREIALDKLARGEKPGAIRYDLVNRTSKPTLHRWRNLQRRFGTVDFRLTRHSQPGPKRVLSRSDVLFSIQRIAVDPTLSPSTLRNILLLQRGKNVSLRTVQRMFERADTTYKTVTNQARERKKEQEFAFRSLISKYDGTSFICIDESSFDGRTPYRKKGRAARGRRAITRQSFQRGVGENGRISAVGVIAAEGLLGVPWKYGSYKAHDFVDMLEKHVFPYSSPFPGPLSVIVMDGPTMHKSSIVKDAIQAHGMKVLYTPAYTPDFMPCELLFGAAKKLLRKEPWRFARPAEREQAIRQLFDEVIPDEVTAVRYMERCGIEFDEEVL